MKVWMIRSVTDEATGHHLEPGMVYDVAPGHADYLVAHGIALIEMRRRRGGPLRIGITPVLMLK